MSRLVGEPASETSIGERLRALGAQHDLVVWALPYEADGERLWAECPRGDWLLGLAARLDGEPHDILRAAASCAELAFDHLPDEAPTARAALAAARDATPATSTEAWTALRDRLEAEADQALDASSQAAAMAVLSVLLTAESSENAPLVVANLVQAAVMDAGECAMTAAVRYVHAETADRVRAVFPPAWATAAFERLGAR